MAIPLHMIGTSVKGCVMYHVQDSTAAPSTEGEAEEDLNTPIILSNKSLLKYDNPELVILNTERISPNSDSLHLIPQLPDITDPVPPPPICKSPSSETTEQKTKKILNAILPTREWMEDDQLFVQHVSSIPCTRTDVIHLHEDLDRELQQRMARKDSICEVRREIYTQCFDEIIRQVTIDCPERGLLLSRVRDEIIMTIDAHQSLCKHSLVVSIRKAVNSEQGKSDLEDKVAGLENEIRELERQIYEQQNKCQDTERQEKQQLQTGEENHTETMQTLRLRNQKLQDLLLKVPITKK